MTGPTFEPDANSAKMFEAYALDAVDVAAANFDVVLDWSEQSISSIEEIAEQLHQELLGDPPREEIVMRFGRMLGSYLAEVCRKHHSTELGTVTWDGSTTAGVRVDGHRVVWPWMKAESRIREGSSHDLRSYYVYMTNRI